MTDDVLERLAAYRPTDALAEWTPAERAAAREALFDDLSVRPARLRFRPRRRPALAPVAAAAAIVALIAGILLAVRGSGDHVTQPGDGSGGTPFDPPAGLSAAAGVHDGQYSALITQELVVGADGTVVADSPDAMTMRDYLATDGTWFSIRTGQQTGCHRFDPGGAPGLDYPTVDFLASLPTDVDALATYLSTHVQGSSSHDEAVFVVVGDVLRTYGGLASPKLRAAMLAVLSRLPEVTLHDGASDQQGRSSIRADFVDQKIRPGEVHSYFFDPTDFRFLEEATRGNGQPKVYSGPSPAYTAPGSGVDPDELTGSGFLSVVTSETVVDRLPQDAQGCRRG